MIKQQKGNNKYICLYKSLQHSFNRGNNQNTDMSIHFDVKNVLFILFYILRHINCTWLKPLQ